MTRQTYQGPGRRAGDNGRYGRLNRERVLLAALGVVDSEGLSALSMRRVAAELDVEAMALYRYTASKDGLLDGLVEALYIELSDALAADSPGTGTRCGQTIAWRTEMNRIAQATRQVLLAHPHAAPLIATRMLAVPLARRPPAVLRADERVLSLLGDAGLDDGHASMAYQAITAWILGYVFTELRVMVDDVDEPDPAIRLGLQHMPAQEFPHLRAMAPALAVHGGPPGLSTGLDALLDCFVAPYAEQDGSGAHRS